MENTPPDPSLTGELESVEKVVEQIIPGASADTARVIAEDEVMHSIPAPSALDVENERLRKAQQGDS